MSTPAQVKELRSKTGAGILDCQKALRESDGDMEKAIHFLRQRGLALAAKKAGRTTAQGSVGAYIHAGGKIGVLVEVNCESDFVARTPEFQRLVKDVAMQIAAANPRYVRREDVPSEEVAQEREIYRAQACQSGKPDTVVGKIVAGKMDNFYRETCLWEQEFIRDPQRKVADVVTEAVAQLGENIVVRRFARFQLGEELPP